MCCRVKTRQIKTLGVRGVIILLELLNRYYLSVSSCVVLKMFQNFALLNFIPKTFQFLFLVTCFNPYSSYYSSITELRGKSTNKRVEWGWSVENMWHGGERRCDNLLSTIVGDTSLHLYICICSNWLKRFPFSNNTFIGND